MRIERLMEMVLLFLFLATGCGEESTGPGFGTPTPDPTPWPVPPEVTPTPAGPTGTPSAADRSNLSLDQAPVVLDGEASGDYAGYSVAMVGDLNGDGFDDLAVGAPLSDALQPDGGKVYVVFGDLYDLESGSLSETMASFVGEGRGDQAGQTVAGAGDINGDGLDDLLIGAPYNDQGGPDAGRVYVVLGRTSGWYPEMRLTYADFSFYGEPGEFLGEIGTVAGGGDINGDGFDDIVLGSPYNGDSFAGAGKVSIVTGKASGWDKKTRLSETAFQLLGSAPQDWTGFSVAVVPDVNDDGMDDVLIGAPHEGSSGDYAGRVYLFLGRPSLPAVSVDVSGMSNVSWLGVAAGEEVGVNVAGAGDVDGDGHEDFVFGGWGAATGRGSGRFYVADGGINYPEDPAEAVAYSLLEAMASIYGSVDYIGRPGLGLGDVDGDGYGDLLLGDSLLVLAPATGVAQENAGAAFYFSGRNTAGWSLVVSSSQADYIFHGTSANDYAGFAVAGRGDMNDDGYMDLAIGAFGAAVGARENAGRVYLYYGGDPFQPWAND